MSGYKDTHKRWSRGSTNSRGKKDSNSPFFFITAFICLIVFILWKIILPILIIMVILIIIYVIKETSKNKESNILKTCKICGRPITEGHNTCNKCNATNSYIDYDTYFANNCPLLILDQNLVLDSNSEKVQKQEEKQRQRDEKIEKERIELEKKEEDNRLKNRKQKKYWMIIILSFIFITLAFILIFSLIKIKESKYEAYDNAVYLLNNNEYIESADLLRNLGDFNDSQMQLEKIYNIAVSFYEQGNINDAAKIFDKVGNYASDNVKECFYKQGKQMLEQGYIAESYYYLNKISEYKDVYSLLKNNYFNILQHWKSSNYQCEYYFDENIENGSIFYYKFVRTYDNQLSELQFHYYIKDYIIHDQNYDPNGDGFAEIKSLSKNELVIYYYSTEDTIKCYPITEKYNKLY